MYKISLTNQKGGVGKTTTTLNLGAGLALAGKRVLLVDLDPQANLTFGLGIDANNLQKTIYDVLSGVARVSDVVIRRPVEDGEDLHVLPASIDLTASDMELVGKMGRETLLKGALGQIEGYDFVLMDCPPNLGLLTVNALVASDQVIIVSQVEPYALRGMTNLMDAIEKVRQFFRPDLVIGGVVATMYDSRKNINKEVLGALSTYFEDAFFQTHIRDNVKLVESPSHGESIFEYDPKSHGAEDYHSLTQEVLKRYE